MLWRAVRTTCRDFHGLERTINSFKFCVRYAFYAYIYHTILYREGTLFTQPLSLIAHSFNRKSQPYNDLMQLPILTTLTGKFINDPMDFPNRQAQLRSGTHWIVYSPWLSVPLFISLCEKYLTITSLCRKCWKWSGCPPRAALYMTGWLLMSGLKNWKRDTEICISGHPLPGE